MSFNQDEMKEKAKLEEEKKDEEKEDPKGIPEFWLTVFKNVDLLSDMLQVGSSRRLKWQRKWVTCEFVMEKSSFDSICWPSCTSCYQCCLSPQEHDEPILKHLQDIKVKFSDPGQPMVSERDSC